MRTLTIADVYLSRGLEVFAAPAWAFERLDDGPALRTADAAWGPLLQELAARRKAVSDRKAADWDATLKAAADPTSPGHELARARVSISVAFRRGSSPPGRGWPRLTSPTARFPRTCAACGSEFFGVGRVAACSNRCAGERRDATRTRGEPRPCVYHHPRPCDWCGEPFKPVRADARFCSGKCRVARHRLHRSPA